MKNLKADVSTSEVSRHVKPYPFSLLLSTLCVEVYP